MTAYLKYRGRPTRVDAKDPDATITYGFDWTSYLGDRVIATSEWIVPPEISVVASSAADGKTTSVLLSGGVAGKSYTVTNRITFVGENGTETDDRSMVVPVKQL